MGDNIQGGGGGGGATSLSREYRKGNWTVSETMVLIEAKKMDDERRQKKSSGGEGMSSKPTELRWKWVEDYCWRKGCLRSQNQCNDKWDNLMRDYKKVRDFDKRPAPDDRTSYWTMDKSQRKDNSLPTNMLPHIYHALLDVVDNKPLLLPPPPPTPLFQPLMLPYPPPPPPPPPPPQQPLLPTVCDSPDSDTSEHSGSPAKRRRTKSTEPSPQGAASPVMNDVASAISKSASVIAEALVASQEREERRHRDLVSLHERRLRIEESKAEVNRQGITGLVDAISKLADSIQALASSKPS